MKKILPVLAAIVVVLSLVGCEDGDKKSNSANSTTLTSNSSSDGNSDNNNSIGESDNGNNSESNTANGDIRPEIKKTIDEYEAFCDKYCKILDENADADEARKTEIALEIWDYHIEREEKSLELTDLADDMTADELKYFIAVDDRCSEKVEQAEKNYFG